MSLDAQLIRKQFPAFTTEGGKRLAYLDTAASAQKPQSVIDVISQFFSHQYANVTRGAYQLSAHASEMYESARSKVARFINADQSTEIIFTRGTTESINLVSASLAEGFSAGDSIVITELEHHSNIVPWQLAEKRHQLKLHFSPITNDASLDYGALFSLIEKYKPKVVSVTHLSNAFGTPVDIRKIADCVHQHKGLLVVDCAQSIAHQRVDVQEMGADFIAFSGHKLYGSTGIGVLWGRAALLESLVPYQGGGGMIGVVSTTGTSWASVPQRFEAGTPAIAEAISLGAAIDFLSELGLDNVEAHDKSLFAYAWNALSAIGGVQLYGPHSIGKEQRSIISFSVEGIHPHDLATVLDQNQVQIRAGHHCAMPALAALNLPATARMSFGVYTENQDIDQLVNGIKAAKKLFKV